MAWNVSGNWNMVGNYLADLDVNYIADVSGFVRLKPATQLGRESSKINLYKHSYNVVSVRVIDDQTGDDLPLDLFDYAEYVIATKDKKVKLKLTLGDGIAKEKGVFKVHIPKGMIGEDFSSTMLHQLRVRDKAGKTLPPLFFSSVSIVDTIK